MIKITKTTNQEAKAKYPYLGESDLGSVVLFLGEDEGIQILKGASADKSFEHSGDWCEEDFKPHSGVLTIQNEL